MFAAALVMVAMMAASALPAFAGGNGGQSNNCDKNQSGIFVEVLKCVNASIL
jgi:hypothetical protein